MSEGAKDEKLMQGIKQYLISEEQRKNEIEWLKGQESNSKPFKIDLKKFLTNDKDK